PSALPPPLPSFPTRRSSDLTSFFAKRPNGLLIEKMRVPLGVIAIIYESRPGVTADAAGLCLKSGNAALLRGGKEAVRTNAAIAGDRKSTRLNSSHQIISYAV